MTWLDRAQRHPWRALALCLAYGAVVSVLLGQDANWDLKNYHLANAWAWLHHRYALDIAPAGMQSFFNPLPDVPYYLLAMGPLAHWPKLLAALMGLPYGAVIFVVGWISVQLARQSSRATDALDVAGVVIAGTGTALVSQIGTTFNEVQLALLVLLAVAVLVDTLRQPPSQRRRIIGGLCLAGVLSGLAAGLKPTAIIYAPALGLAWMAATRGTYRWWGALVLGSAMLLAFAAAYGVWGWHLYQLTGNPVFPMFNGIFASDWAPRQAGTDPHFLPHGIVQWLVYPLFWAFHHTQKVAESGMSDPRLALAGLSLLGFACAAMKRARHDTPAANRALCVFGIVAYLGWLGLFSIYRYAVTLEVLSGIAIAAGLRSLLAAWRGDRRRWRGGLALVGVLFVAGFTHYPRWGRTAYAARVIDADIPALPAHSLVVVLGQPHAYLLPFFHDDDVRFVGVTWFSQATAGHHFWTRSAERLRHHKGPRFAVLRDDSRHDERILQALAGLAVDAHDCHPIQANLEQDKHHRVRSRHLRLCRLVQAP